MLEWDNTEPALDKKANPSLVGRPRADFIIGNPPFIGNKRMRDVLGGTGYAEALREGYSGAVASSVDFVMYWWQLAATALENGQLQRFGFTSTRRRLHQKPHVPSLKKRGGNCQNLRAL